MNSNNQKEYTIPILGTVALVAQDYFQHCSKFIMAGLIQRLHLSFCFLDNLLSLDEIEESLPNKKYKFKDQIEFKSVSLNMTKKIQRIFFIILFLNKSWRV